MTAISIGIGGLAGWRVLQRMEPRQVEALAKDPVVRRATDYFRENLSGVSSADGLVGDYKMLQVALGAFGLDADISNKAFIRKILESDLDDKSSLANRLADKRYLKFAKAFQERESGTTGQTISDAYVQRQFEARVGKADESFRLALNARNELKGFVTRTSTDKTLWYEVLGNEPLRRVIGGALGLGTWVSNLPVERQAEEFMSAAEKVFGTSRFSRLGADNTIDRVITRYLAMSQIQAQTTSNRYSAALALLSG